MKRCSGNCTPSSKARCFMSNHYTLSLATYCAVELALFTYSHPSRGMPVDSVNDGLKREHSTICT
jgi:hypothetical protein